MKRIVKNTIPLLTAAALLAVPAWTTADYMKTEIVSAENSADAGDVITLEIGEVTGEAGTKVKLPVFAKNIGHGFSAVQFDYNMDDSFKVTRVLKGDVSGSWTVGRTGRTLQFLESDGMNITSEGKIGRIEIEIPAGTPDGVYEVSISVFQGSCVDTDNNKQVKIPAENFNTVSGKIIIGNGGSGNDPAPAPSPSPSHEKAESPSPSPSPSPSAVSSPSAKASPSVKPSPSVKTTPSAKTSPSAAAPSAKSSSSPSSNVKTSASPGSSASPNSGNAPAPSDGSPASPSGARDVSDENNVSDVNNAGNASPDAAKTPANGENSGVSDENGSLPAENDEKTSEVTSENRKDADEKTVSKKITIAAIIGSCVAVLLVLLLVFRRD